MTETQDKEAIASLELFLLKGQMLDLKKMSKKELQAEIQLWRNIWQWTPDEVRYWVARTLSVVSGAFGCLLHQLFSPCV